MLDLGPLILGTVLTLAAVVSALIVGRRADSDWAPVAVVGGGTALGLAVLGLAIVVTSSATDADADTAPTASTANAASVAPSAATGSTGTSTPSAGAPPATPTAIPTSEPATTPTAAATPTTLYVRADDGGVRWRSACNADALLAGWWPNGTAVEVLRSGPGGCEGWSLVRSGTLASWISDEVLVVLPPTPVAAVPTSTPRTTAPSNASSPAPTVSPVVLPTQRGHQGSAYGTAIEGWIGRIRDIEASLNANFEAAVADSDWSAHAARASQLATAALMVRTEVEQVTPYVAQLAPNCAAAMAPLVAMGSALVQLANAYEEWLATGLVENQAAERVGVQRGAIDAGAAATNAALRGCS